LQEQNNKGYTSYLKFTGMGFAMIAIILAGSFLGQYLDKLWAMEQPWMTIVLSLLSVAMSIYYFISQLNK